ncbi:hypothetical protein HGM15179_019287 [Zosterops borbonicus]|uniref:Uncharacterized protein n=1 Tax=Zosterops borbonicus TaxID=364589 RepID=A0A8K1DBI0_9PASS|nr:hypothetical protein HGM15179_019287 [Zosterops borbonicus]
MDPRLWWLVLLPVLAFQPGSHLAAGGFLSAPRIPVLGIIGDRVVLPCQVGSTPLPENFSIHWTFHGQSQRIPVSSYDRKGRREEPDERYRGRVEFFHREFRGGNVSLLLRDVQSSDQGSYSCQVSFQNVSREVLVELEVAAIGEDPSVILRSPEKRDLGVSCRASGWFPRPELLWLDGRGKVRPEPMTTTATVMPGGLFSIEASMRIQPGSDLEISCRVLNRRLNASRESRIRIHDSFLPSISQWLQIFLVVLFLNLALISIIFCQLQTKVEFKERFGKCEFLCKKWDFFRLLVDFWEARSHAVPVSVDPEAPSLDLGDAQDPLPVLPARAPLGWGRFYWEVELGRARRWALGVLRAPPGPDSRDSGPNSRAVWALRGAQGQLPDSRDSGPNSRDSGPNSREVWALRGAQGQLLSSAGRALGELPRGLAALGLLLDLPRARLEFYDAERMELLAGLRLDEPAGRFLPFVSRGEEGALRIRPVPVPVPL